MYILLWKDYEVLNSYLRSNFGFSQQIFVFQMPDRCEVVAQQKTLRECKVLIKKVHQSFCRINGGAATEFQLEISDVLPLKTIDSLFDVEEKLQNNEYKEEMVWNENELNTLFLFSMLMLLQRTNDVH